MDQSLRDAVEQGNIAALYQSLRDPTVGENIDALYLSLRAAEQGRIDALYQRLKAAAEQGNIDDLYALMGNANVLDSMDKIPIVETPLHIAASLGHTQFAMEIMKLKPSFARKLNQDGFSPMHLALKKHYDSPNDVALKRNLTLLVCQLLDVEKDLVRVKGREGVTPLHYVVEIENLYFLDKFVEACPESMRDLTIGGENVLHIALKNDKVKAFWLLIGYRPRFCSRDAYLLVEKLLCWQDYKGNTLFPVDDEGNTLLHIAVSRNQLKVVWWLLDKEFVDVFARNFEGKTVFDILGRQTQGVNQLIRCRLMIMRRQRSVRCLIYIILFPILMPGKISNFVNRLRSTITEERRNAMLVVATLLLTVTYQAALGPDQQPNEFNCTAPINATGANQFNCTARFNANSTKFNSNTHIAFYAINTLTYYLTNVTLLFLLPPDFIAILLYYLLGFLFLCYCISTPLLNAPLVSTVSMWLLPSFPIFGLVTSPPFSSGRLANFFLLNISFLLYIFLGMLSLAAIALINFSAICARITATGGKSGFICHFVNAWRGGSEA